jgi:hypothetical protein
MRLTMKGKNGSLNQFTQKVINKNGEVVEYPKVNGIRDPDNPKHWRWKLSWKEKVDEQWVTRGLSVKPSKVAIVKNLITRNVGIQGIQEFLS